MVRGHGGMRTTVRAMVLLAKEKVRFVLHPGLWRKSRQLENERTHPGLWSKSQELENGRTQFYAAFVANGDLVFDVGANLGNRTAAFLNLGAKVVAVEPQSVCGRFLELKYGRRISLVKAAVGSAPGTLELRVDPGSTTLATLSGEWIDRMREGRFSSSAWTKSETVEVTTLDALISRLGHPAFIKIDVEGFEPEVLRGLSQPVGALSFEYATPEMTAQALECVRLIGRLSQAYEFNYSIGESAQLALGRWIGAHEITEIIEKRVEQLGGFGDIYARLKS
jgi:FkbM family methyltransferase